MLYYALFVVATMINQINSVCLYKKYQTTTGTGLVANVIYMIINGIVSSILPTAVILFLKRGLEATPYSLIFATATVICAAVSLICMLKVYERGQIAIVNILVTIGGIVLPCLWGVLVWKEELSMQALLAIVIMIGAVFFMFDKNGEKLDKKSSWMYVIIILCTSLLTLLSKQHQIEKVYETVDTISYSIWVGVIRTVLFVGIGILYVIKNGQSEGELIHKGFPSQPKGTVLYATLSSIASGGCYILTLFTATVLPVVITSPLGTGIGMVMSSLLPWLIYEEQLTGKQWAGIVLSFIGVFLFLLA